MVMLLATADDAGITVVTAQGQPQYLIPTAGAAGDLPSRLTTELWVGDLEPGPGIGADGGLLNPFGNAQQALSTVVNPAAPGSDFTIRLQARGLSWGPVTISPNRTVTFQCAGMAFLDEVNIELTVDGPTVLNFINVGGAGLPAFNITGEGDLFLTINGREVDFFGVLPGWQISNNALGDQHNFTFTEVGLLNTELLGSINPTVNALDGCVCAGVFQANRIIKGTGTSFFDCAYHIDSVAFTAVTDGLRECVFDDQCTIEVIEFVADAMTLTQVAEQGVPFLTPATVIFLEQALGIGFDDSSVPFAAAEMQTAIMNIANGYIAPFELLSRTCSDSGGDIFMGAGTTVVPLSQGGPDMVATFNAWAAGDVLQVTWNVSLKSNDAAGLQGFFFIEYSDDSGATWNRMNGAAGDLGIAAGQLAVNASGQQDITVSPAPGDDVMVRLGCNLFSNNWQLDFGAGNTCTFRANRYSSTMVIPSGGTF